MKRIAAILAAVVAIVAGSGTSFAQDATGAGATHFRATPPKCRTDDGLTPRKRAVIAEDMLAGNDATNFEHSAICAIAAALDGDSLGQSVTGLHYATWGTYPLGLTTVPAEPYDAEAALYWLNKAGNAGDPYAAYTLGQLYAYGVGVPQDDTQAIAWLQKAKAAHVNDMASMALRPLLARPEEEKAFLSQHLDKANRGDAKAMVEMASAYVIGAPLRRNLKEAASWLRKAADLGDSTAQSILGRMYYEGVGVDRDEDQAVDWLLKASVGKDHRNDILLVTLYKSANVDTARKAAIDARARQASKHPFTEPDPPQPPEPKPDMTALQAQADKGDRDAEYTLGIFYLGDFGDAPNADKALLWLTKAAEQGSLDAYINIGDIYYAGKLVPQDYAKALSWYERAAEKGDSTGLHNAAVMYRDGLGAPVNIMKAYTLAMRLKIAEGTPKAVRLDFGHPSGTETLLAGMRPKLSVEDRARALKAACEMYLAWHPVI